MRWRVAAAAAAAATLTTLSSYAVPATALPAATAVTAASDESLDFRFPAADLMRLPSTTPGVTPYVAYGASLKGGPKVPYTKVLYRNDTFERRGQIDGDAWTDVQFPTGYWADRSAHLWTPAVVSHLDADGKRRFYLFYSTRKLNSTKFCIGYATSLRWNGGWHPKKDPLFCAQGAWAIDADVSQGQGGTWLSLRNGDWTRNGYTGIGAGRLRFVEPARVALSTPVQLLGNATLEWTHSRAEQIQTIENPNAVFWGNRWYLFYSGNNWYANRYSTGVASCGEALLDGRCTPVQEPTAYFAYKPDPDGELRFRPGLPAKYRHKLLPGNKRGPGAFDAFRAPDGSWWASWNYITDASPLPGPDKQVTRKSRLGRITLSGSGLAADFTATWR